MFFASFWAQAPFCRHGKSLLFWDFSECACTAVPAWRRRHEDHTARMQQWKGSSAGTALGKVGSHSERWQGRLVLPSLQWAGSCDSGRREGGLPHWEVLGALKAWSHSGMWPSWHMAWGTETLWSWTALLYITVSPYFCYVFKADNVLRKALCRTSGIWGLGYAPFQFNLSLQPSFSFLYCISLLLLPGLVLLPSTWMMNLSQGVWGLTVCLTRLPMKPITLQTPALLRVAGILRIKVTLSWPDCSQWN